MGSREPAQPWEDLPLTPERLRTLLAGRTRATVELATHRRAAVLVALFERAGELRLVLTLRAAALRAHSGQWSFPGGRIDDGDAGAAAAALREAEEEIAVNPSAVVVLGSLSDLETSTGYVITPVVGWIDPAPRGLRASEAEVAEIAEIPWRRFLDPTALEIVGEVEKRGRKLPVYRFHIDGRNIWGATARIIHELVALVQ